MRSPLLAAAVVGTYLSLTCGCVSNQYVIPKAELDRLASLPPSHRGQRVHVVQKLGSRDQPAVENGELLSPELYATEYEIYDQPGQMIHQMANADVEILLGDGGPSPGATGRLSPRTGVGPVMGGPLPRSSGPAGTTWNRALPRGGPRGSAPVAHNDAWNLGNLGGGGGQRGGGGGGGGGDEAAVLAVVVVVVVAIAVLAATSLVVTEGLRFDGHVQLHPEQIIHLVGADGGERPLTLATLTPADAAGAREAVVKDDEDFGLRFGPRRPLDRQGAAFKVDVGSLDSLCACYSATGLASNIQLGYFPHHRFGLLLSLALGGGRSALDHMFQRHSVNLEAQFFPLEWWRIHVGGFGHGGLQVAYDEGGERDGLAWGGGAILEIELTTRMALTGRFDVTRARTAPDGRGWANLSMLTAGIAIY